VDVVSLLVSELATNCVQYASGDFTVSIEQSPDEVRVDVADEDEHPVTMREARPTDVTGRGLHIVEKMADDWGVRELKDHAGKSVWFTVRLPVHAFGVSRGNGPGTKLA